MDMNFSLKSPFRKCGRMAAAPGLTRERTGRPALGKECVDRVSGLAWCGHGFKWVGGVAGTGLRIENGIENRVNNAAWRSAVLACHLSRYAGGTAHQDDPAVAQNPRPARCARLSPELA